MTSNNGKLRALFLAALMVLSITVGSIAFAGSAAAHTADTLDDDPNYDDADGNLSASAWQGQELFLHNGSNTELDTDSELAVHAVNDDRDGIEAAPIQEFSLSENLTYLLDTSRYDNGEYVIINQTTDKALKFVEGAGQSETYNTTDSEVTSASFTISTQDFSAEFVDSDDDPVDEVEDEGDDATEYISFDSNRRTFDVWVNSDSLDQDELEDIFNRSNQWEETDWDDDDGLKLEDASEGDYEVNFTGIDTGDYDFSFEVTDTEVSDSDSITVTEKGEGSVDFVESSVDVSQGGVAEIQLELSDTDKGRLLIGDWDDDGFQLNVTVEDDGDDQVTVYFNTLKASQQNEEDLVDNNDVVWADTEEEDDEVTEAIVHENVSSILDTGNYELATHTASYVDAQDSPDNVGSMYINEPSVNSVNTWVASADNIDDVDEFSELQTAIEDGKVTESSSIAAGDLLEGGADGDVLITQIDASGIDGLMRTEEADFDQEEGTIEFDGDSLTEYNEDADNFSKEDQAGITGYSLWMEEQDPGANTDETEFDFAGKNAIDKVYFDGEGNYYVIAETTSIVGNADTGEIEDDDTFTVEFNLKDNFLLDYDEDDWDDDNSDNYETVTTDLTFEEPDVGFDVTDVDGTDYVTVSAAAEQAISGTTNVAPGSEIDVRATGEDEARFVLEQSDVVVQNDGTFSAEFDFSEQAAGDEFTARAYGGTLGALDTDDQEADGLIQEAQPEETTTEEPADTTTEEPADTTTTTEEPADTTTEAPADTTTEAPTETPTETPGFTMGLALVALLGAALLALRRQN
ncbi:hypothetical protein HTSR_1542 [Halodesulfurarchaeum formicicum]|uniref:S-layer glycoprotein n=2 Tax=Halodesulfurarchaeum formicicum TaxID=1873524 RepID=A0A1D8S5U7_9EURY|nr:hypothetical protein HTSR_1542 [Halodesulfurarchaeum formicicum]